VGDGGFFKKVWVARSGGGGGIGEGGIGLNKTMNLVN
jgi:hypothetical protein